MQFDRPASTLPRLLAAALLVSAAAAAQAARGYVVDRSQESMIVPGMTAAEVQQSLGRPAYNTHYRSDPGSTLIYYVSGPSRTAFDVEVDRNGVVVSTREAPQPLSRYGY